MNCYFEKVSKFKNVDFELPKRKTYDAAGYDFVVAEDTLIPPYNELMGRLDLLHFKEREKYSTFDKNLGEFVCELGDMAKLTKDSGTKPTLVSTGVKCYLPENTYLELSVRSSCPLKYWLIMANGVGKL